MKKHPVMEVLAKASKGLLFQSETDASLKGFLWEGGGNLTQDRVRELAGAGQRGGSLLAWPRALAFAGTVQHRVLVGVEIWHVGSATLQTGTSPRCSRLDRRNVPRLSAAARPVYPLWDFVTTL